jgi:hypothetical protein
MSAPVLLALLLAAEPILDVNVDAAIDDADQVKQWVEKEGEAALKRAGVDPEGGGTSGWKIDIEVGGATYDYRIEFALSRGGERLVDQPDVFTCECTNDQLIEELGPTLDHVVDLMEKSDTESEDTGHADSGNDSGDGDDAGDTGEQPGKGRLGKLGKAGVALIPIGAVALGVGIGLVVAGEKDSSTLAFETEGEGRDFRPPGYALLAAGGAALIIGIALLATDRARDRRKRSALSPVVSPSYAGLRAAFAF